MYIKVSKKEVTSNSKKSKEVFYLFKTKIGTLKIRRFVMGNFRGVVADKTFHTMELENVPEDVMREFKRSRYYPTEENLRLYEERKREEEEEERIEREREEQQRLEEERRKAAMENVDANAINLEALISKINEIWNGKEEEQDVVFDGVKILFKRGQSITENYQNVKISNAKLGLSFMIKRKRPNYDIDNVLNNAFRFVFEICKLGAKIENKGIVTAISKKQGKPSIKTLKENGFTIDNATYQTLDLNEVEDVKTLFNTYKRAEE